MKKEDTKGENSRFYKSQQKHQRRNGRHHGGVRHKNIGKPDKTVVDKKAEENKEPLMGGEGEAQRTEPNVEKSGEAMDEQ